jgi:hypothetical protein
MSVNGIRTAKTMAENSQSFKQLDIMGIEQIELKKIDKHNEQREKELRALILPLVKELGEKTADGHIEFMSQYCNFTIQNRKKVVIKEDTAISILTQKKLLDRATKKVVDADKLQDLYLEGAITKEDLAEMLEEKPSEALFVEKRKG